MAAGDLLCLFCLLFTPTNVEHILYNGYAPLGCRYQFNPRSFGAVSELRLTSTTDLNVNFSVSNANTIIQAYSSWNNLSNVHEYHRERVRTSPLVPMCHMVTQSSFSLDLCLLRLTGRISSS